MNNDLLTGNWSEHYTNSYYSPDYHAAGYNAYMSKSIDVQASGSYNPTGTTLATPKQYSNNMINFDSSQVTGSLGDVIRIGTINLDGRRGRISIYDDLGYEAIILGDLDG